MEQEDEIRSSETVTRETPFPSPSSTAVFVNRKCVHLYHVKDTEWGPILTLPLYSALELIDECDGQEGRWLQVRGVDDKVFYIQRGDVAFMQPLLSKEEMLSFAKEYLGLPYTWGGRSSFGYDCSGFVQMLYRRMGVDLPRNSRNQATWEGFKEICREELTAGDLIFFGGSDKKIRHVAMYIGEGEMIHAVVAENKPYLRISSLDTPPWDGSASYSACRLFRSLH